MDVVTKFYWFPNVHKKITNHIRNCFKCIAFSPPCGKTEGKIHSIPKGDQPSDTIHVDHVKFNDSRVTEKKYILVVIDGFTKFTKLYTAKITTAKEAINSLKLYFACYSKPKTIVTDKGSCFTSEEFYDFLKKLDIKHVEIATGSPQANGQVERVNKTIAPILGKLSDTESGLNWTKVIEKAEFALNNTVHKSTGKAPSELLFGTIQRGEVSDPLAEYVSSKINNNERNLKTMRSKASDKIIVQQAKAKSQADKKRKDAYEYKEEDYVMIKNFDCTAGISPKLKPKFKGPYRVVKILRNNRYVVADIMGCQVSQKKYQGVWEAKNMRLWRKANVFSRPCQE